jgi:phage N-6-adenine-methyltransferase
MSSAALRRMPAQKPGRSIQTYATPPEFIEAVKRRFKIKQFDYDLAASQENAKAKHFFCEEEDSLKQDWHKLGGSLWLNPPFGRIEPWAKKCLDAGRGNARTIYFLTPASVGSNWWRDCIDAPMQHGYADVAVASLFLNGRLCFDGKAGFPKDCAMTLFGPSGVSGYEVWDWRKEK